MKYKIILQDRRVVGTCFGHLQLLFHDGVISVHTAMMELSIIFGMVLMWGLFLSHKTNPIRIFITFLADILNNF